jgi:SAM-dependent methyltransferase
MYIVQHYYDPFPPMLQKAEELANRDGIVLEIGPGCRPFSKANTFVDQGAVPGPITDYHRVDINREPLPFRDKEVDFVYCRHVLEDLYNPLFLLGEINRVAKAGYLETPSPIVECTRGVDGGSPIWRGFHHHHNLFYVDNGTLFVLRKLPLIEHIPLGPAQDDMIRVLNGGPLFWNTYFFFTGTFSYSLHPDDPRPQDPIAKYANQCLHAVRMSYQANLAFGKALGILKFD